jgi:hypothetical protein
VLKGEAVNVRSGEKLRWERLRYTVIDGEVTAEKRNGVRSFYVPEPLGSTVALLDNTQTKTDTFSYWPYGEKEIIALHVMLQTVPASSIIKP